MNSLFKVYDPEYLLLNNFLVIQTLFFFLLPSSKLAPINCDVSAQKIHIKNEGIMYSFIGELVNLNPKIANLIKFNFFFLI